MRYYNDTEYAETSVTANSEIFVESNIGIMRHWLSPLDHYENVVYFRMQLDARALKKDLTPAINTDNYYYVWSVLTSIIKGSELLDDVEFAEIESGLLNAVDIEDALIFSIASTAKTLEKKESLITAINLSIQRILMGEHDEVLLPHCTIVPEHFQRIEVEILNECLREIERTAL
jgi:hypothetical protein